MTRWRKVATPNGFDRLWVQAINNVLRDRDSDVRLDDLTERLWESYLGPMIDAIERGVK